MKVYIDPGHGGSDPGAQGNGLREKDLTLDIALRLQGILLNDYENVEVRLSRTSDTTKSLSQRTSEANSWGADYYLSIHINSADSTAQGYEDYIYSGLSDSSSTARYPDIIHAEVVKVNGLRDRGKKKANFHVLRESAMPALLTENGFISNSNEAALMNQASWRQSVAQGHENGLALAFNLKRKPAPPPLNDPGTGALYKVIAGSFQSKENADERVAALKAKGFEAFVFPIGIATQTWYRAQAGAFSNRANAEQWMDAIKQAGFPDVFITV